MHACESDGRDNRLISRRRIMPRVDKPMSALRLHTSIHDDTPCLCGDCQRLWRAIERNATRQPSVPKAA